MADAQVLYAESVAATTAATTSWVALASIADTSFTAGKTYLILANQVCSHASAANETRVRLVHGTTPTVFDDASCAYEGLSNTMKYEISYMFFYTQPGTAEKVELQISSSATTTVTNILSQIVAIKLSDDFTENTDYFKAEDLVNYTMTSTPTAKATTGSFTPNGTDRWLYIGHMIYDVVSITDEIGFELYDSVAGVLGLHQVEGEDATNDFLGANLYWAGIPTNSARTLAVRPFNEGGSNVMLASRVFAINLSKFAQSASTFNASEVDPATSPTFTNVATISPTPTNTGNWVMIGYLTQDVNENTTDLGIRLQVNPDGGGLVSDPNFSSTAPGINQQDPLDEIAFSVFNLASLNSGASRQINYDVTQVAGTLGRVEDCGLVAFSVALAAAGTQYPQTVSGGVTPSGEVSKQGNKVLAGTLTDSGTTNKLTSKTFSGGFTPAGSLLKETAKILSGALSSIVGTLTAARLFFTSLDGTLTTAGTLLKQASKTFDGTVTSAGNLFRDILKSLSGAITPSGTANKSSTKTFDGSLTSDGTLSKSDNKLLDGTVTSSGSITKQGNKSLDGTMTSDGTISKIANKLLSGALSIIAGTLSASKLALKSLDGTLTSAGTLLKQTEKTFFGSNTPSGTLLKTTSKLLDGTLALAGSLSKSAEKILAGILTLAGDLQTQFSSGGQTFFKDLSGTLTSGGELLKNTAKDFAGTLTQVGDVVKSTTKTFVGTLTSSGIVTGVSVFLKSLDGILASSGELVKQANKTLFGIVSSDGTIMKGISKLLQGTLISTGSITKAISKAFSGILASVGSLFGLSNVPPADIPTIYLTGSLETIIDLQGEIQTIVELTGNKNNVINLLGNK